MKKTILIGWGNPDRQDDGVAWHVLRAVAVRLGLPVPDSYEAPFECGHVQVEFLFLLQLTPELAEDIARYERVVFVDAAVGGTSGEITLGGMAASQTHLPVLSHHLSPEALMVMARSLYGAQAEALLLTVTGTEFQFSRELSAMVQAAVPAAAEKILAWIQRD
ncbi:MAG: hydrogenase maturation protease [Anaerolineaceae bacterium]|nr:hydrogenase maturation protease [Anaerolineaceae bacterium]